ncbi:MAG TPA: hypothetical protein VJS64_02065 [Pyrinomonadaceae bacterium]|nr:hypothetical protein [Pyrinomonadaceae bacterium]
MPSVLDDLVVIHDPARAEDRLPTALNSLRWETCLRRITLLDRIEAEYPSKSDVGGSEIYQGKDAYRFLLEVVCGLRSPLVGETEVLGQFRSFYARAKFPPTSWGWSLRQITSNLIVDAKVVRQRHLEGLGSHCYGGLVRQHLKGIPSVALIGAGQLANEIIPWIVRKAELTVFCRDSQRAQQLNCTFPQIHVAQFAMADSAPTDEEMALVIAAPISAHEIETWVRRQSAHFVKAVDLRGEAAFDPVRFSFPVIELPEIYSAAMPSRPDSAASVAAARAEINLAAERQANQAQFRPFGWEDLCA